MQSLHRKNWKCVNQTLLPKPIVRNGKQSVYFTQYAQEIRIRAVKVPSSGQIKFFEMDVAFGGCKIAKTTQHLQLP